MKKTVLFAAALVLAATTFAQDGLTSKKGEAYLPEAGDWAIGWDAMPFLDYASNGNLPNASFIANNQPMTLVGKMFKDESTAYRAKLRIGFGSNTLEGVSDTSNTTLTGEITDEMKTSNMMITLGGGIEKRKGNTRLQGFYGAEALVSFGGSATEYTYADAGRGNTAAGSTTPVVQPSQFNFGNNIVMDPNTGLPTDERVMKNTQGSTFQFSLRGFIGVEYFFAPKISVSAEYGWGLMMSSTGAGEVDTEEYAISSGAAAGSEANIARKHTTGASSAFGIDTDNNGGQITLMFHF